MERSHRTASTRQLVVRLIRRRWRQPLQIAGLTGMVLVLMGASAFRSSPSRRLAAREERRQAAPARVLADGVVTSGIARGIGAAFEGRIAAVAVRPGERVKKGEMLFTMDTSSLQSQLAAAKEEAAGARAGLQQVRAGRAADLGALQQQAAALAAQLQEERRRTQEWKQAPLAADAQSRADPYGSTVVEIPAFDGARMQQLEAELLGARRQLDQVKRTWEPSLQSAQAEYARAAARVKHVKGLPAAAKRCSPIEGVVTGVYAQSGDWARPGDVLVRVDDPSSYKVVTLVGADLGEQLKPGEAVQLNPGAGTVNGKLVKIESGWDQNLFNYWVWVKPAQPRALQPDEKVKLALPRGEHLAARPREVEG